MKKIAVYPGSFNPWHGGHDDVLDKALQVFDEVIIAQGVNPEKKLTDRARLPTTIKSDRHGKNIRFACYNTLLKDFLETVEVHAIIKGIRNSQDMEYEKTQQRWNEDLGLKIPTFYVIADREWEHVSSSALRMLEKFKK